MCCCYSPCRLKAGNSCSIRATVSKLEDCCSALVATHVAMFLFGFWRETAKLLDSSVGVSPRLLGLPALTPSHLHTDRSTPSPKNSFPCFAAEAMAEIRLVREIAAQATAALAGSGEGEGDGPNPNQEENASSEVGGGQRARASFLFSFSWVPQRNE